MKLLDLSLSALLAGGALAFHGDSVPRASRIRSIPSKRDHDPTLNVPPATCEGAREMANCQAYYTTIKQAVENDFNKVRKLHDDIERVYLVDNARPKAESKFIYALSTEPDVVHEFVHRHPFPYGRFQDGVRYLLDADLEAESFDQGDVDKAADKAAIAVSALTSLSILLIGGELDPETESMVPDSKNLKVFKTNGLEAAWETLVYLAWEKSPTPGRSVRFEDAQLRIKNLHAIMNTIRKARVASK